MSCTCGRLDMMSNDLLLRAVEHVVAVVSAGRRAAPLTYAALVDKERTKQKADCGFLYLNRLSISESGVEREREKKRRKILHETRNSCATNYRLKSIGLDNLAIRSIMLF